MNNAHNKRNAVLSMRQAEPNAISRARILMGFTRLRGLDLINEQRRYQVFVSSTYLDLREARQLVTKTLLEADAFPAGMELFPATDDDAWTLIQEVIDECDYYLLIIGGKYGSIDPATDLSYTEMEFDYAISKKKPVMAFVHGDTAKLTGEALETTDAKRKKLESFRAKVKAAKHVRQWNTPDQLAGMVASTYNKFTRRYPATGWMRADQVANADAVRALAKAQAKIADLELQLASVRTTAPPEAEGLAQGDQIVKLPFLATVIYKTLTNTERTMTTWVKLPLSWDRVYESVAPKLLQDAEDSELRDALCSFASVLKNELIEEKALGEIRDRGLNKEVQLSQLAVKALTIHDDEWGTVTLQLVALGLMIKSDRKRSLSDAGNYWMATPYGETRAIQLRALKAGEDTPSYLLTPEQPSLDVQAADSDPNSGPPD